MTPDAVPPDQPVTPGQPVTLEAGPTAYLGPAGTFTEQAARSLAGPDQSLLPRTGVAAALDALRDGTAVAAVVPLENSVEGSVATTLDELAQGSLVRIRREVVLTVEFALVARPGTTIGDVATVTTIPHAEAQVRRWLREHLPHAAFVPAPSTADGARAVAAGQADAAVCAPLAAQTYGLAVLADAIADRRGAQTRFVEVVRPGTPLPGPTGTDRTTLVAYEAADHPGSLLEMLTEFAVRGVNLTRLESRPTGGGLGRYCFSLDAEGHVAEARVGEALRALYRICAEVRFLGSYPRADGVAPTMRRGVSDPEFVEAQAWLDRLRAGQG